MNNKRKLLIATRNKGKFLEITEKLKDLDFEFASLSDFENAGEVDESAMTFEGNAIIKAVTFGTRTNCLTISDDSGLEVDTLDGRPGIMSARYAEGSDENRCRKILEEMKNVPDEERAARFKCVVALYDPKNQKTETFEGKVEGVILREPKGNGGFGYDPIFYIPEIGKTLAEISAGEKNLIDHRGKALEKVIKILMDMK